MNGVEVLLAGWRMNHNVAREVLATTPADVLHERQSKDVNPAGAILVHAVLVEDYFVQGTCNGGPPLAETGGWSAKTGVEFTETSFQTDDWGDRVRLDVARFMPYVEAVFARSEEFLASLSDADLDREIQAGPQLVPMGHFLSTIAPLHFLTHLGEVTALSGFMGHRQPY